MFLEAPEDPSPPHCEKEKHENENDDENRASPQRSSSHPGSTYTPHLSTSARSHSVEANLTLLPSREDAVCDNCKSEVVMLAIVSNSINVKFARTIRDTHSFSSVMWNVSKKNDQKRD